MIPSNYYILCITLQVYRVRLLLLIYHMPGARGGDLVSSVAGCWPTSTVETGRFGSTHKLSGCLIYRLCRLTLSLSSLDLASIMGPSLGFTDHR